MKIHFTSPNFKGYDAVQLQALHIATKWGKIKDELVEVAKTEEFEIKESVYNGSFNQDFKVILENNGSTRLVMEESRGLFEPYLDKISDDYQMPVQLLDRADRLNGFITGGNFFLGKMPNGEKYILISAGEYRRNQDKKAISELYNVKEENIHFIVHQDYHLDMSIRPIGYPYVLVNDPSAVSKNKEKVKINKGVKNKSAKQPQKPKDVDKFQQYAYQKCIEDLKNAGLKPITIAGIYDLDVNFINAIINKHKDGTISYITNSSKCDNIYTSKYQKLFEKDLRRKLEELAKIDPNAPKLKNIYFIQGESYGSQNEVMNNLMEGAGGVHCMCLEEPKFDVWG